MNQTSIRLVALDMDGTVTQHRTQLEEENKIALDRLGKKYKLLFVGAGDCIRIWNQLNRYPVDIVGNYGLQYAEPRTDGTLSIVQSEKIFADKKIIDERVQQIRHKYGYEIFSGSSVEFHDSGIITLPLLGTAANISDKLKFDPDKSKRRKIYADVCSYFPEYTVVIGGSSSFDIIPPSYGKYAALKKYAKNHGYEITEVLYIGDDYGPGGNDEQVFNSEIKTIGISDYHDFPNVVNTLL